MTAEKLIYERPRLVTTALIAAGCIMVIIATKSTVGLLSSYFSLQGTLATLGDTPATAQAKYPEEAFGEVDLNAILFKTISESAQKNHVTVKSINAPVAFSTSDFMLMTEEIVLEGDFVNAVRCLDEASSNLKLIKMCSLKFERDLSPKSNALYTRVYFQMIKKNERDPD